MDNTRKFKRRRDPGWARHRIDAASRKDDRTIRFSVFGNRSIGPGPRRDLVAGSLEQLSAKTALLRINGKEPLNLLTNIKLLITTPSAPEDIRQSDIYAKVQTTGEKSQTYIITFTARSPAIIEWMNGQLRPSMPSAT